MYCDQPIRIIKVIGMSGDKEMVNMMMEAIPQMLKNFVLAPYTEESAKQTASAVVIFYNELKKKKSTKYFRC